MAFLAEGEFVIVASGARVRALVLINHLAFWHLAGQTVVSPRPAAGGAVLVTRYTPSTALEVAIRASIHTTFIFKQPAWGAERAFSAGYTAGAAGRATVASGATLVVLIRARGSAGGGRECEQEAIFALTAVSVIRPIADRTVRM